MIKQSEIKIHLEDFLQENPSSTRTDCPSPGKLIKLVRLGLSAKKRNALVAHITGCNSCARELKSIHEILKEEKLFDKTATDILAQQARKEKGNSNLLKDLFSHPAWSFRMAVSVLVFIVLASPLFFIFKNQQTAIERDPGPQVNQMSPDEKSMSLAELVFQWEEIQNSEYYTVEIFDDSLSLIWRSERILINRVDPSEKLRGLLQKDSTYLWMVTSFLTNGKKIESGLAKFILK